MTLNADPLTGRIFRRVFFSGAGGVGKTSVVGPLETRLARGNVRVKFMPSVSRDFFASQGITSEQAGLDRPEKDRLDFQLALFEFYCRAVEKECTLAYADGQTNVLLLDRSPFDHIAFCIYNAPNLMTYDLLKQLFLRARDLIGHPWGNIQIDTEWKVVRFPCLTSWIDNNVVKDGMRHAPAGKNFMVDALIDNIMRTSMSGMQLGDHIIRLPDLDIPNRARFIAENL
jgi:predicted ATPase